MSAGSCVHCPEGWTELTHRAVGGSLASGRAGCRAGGRVAGRAGGRSGQVGPDQAAPEAVALGVQVEPVGAEELLAGSAVGADHRGVDVHVGADHPRAEQVAALGQRRLDRGEGDDLSTLAPLYLRRSDAEINRERRHGVAGPSQEMNERHSRGTAKE